MSTLAFTKDYNWIDLDPAKAVTTIKSYSEKIIHPNQTTTADHIVPQTTLSDSNNVAKTFRVIEQPATIANDDDKLRPPFVYDGGYTILAHYLHKSIRYIPTANDKGGMVVVGFTLGNDLKINDPKVEISAGDKLDNLALEAFKNYKGTVNDDAGKHLVIAVYFFTDNYDVFNYKFPNMADPSGAVAITGVPFKFKVTSKGYEYDEAGGDRIWVYQKDGSCKYYDKNKLTDEDAKTLKDKYGYIFPSNSNGAMGWLPPVDGNKYRWVSMTMNSYLNEPYTKDFYEYIYNNLQYPPQAKADLKTSVVLIKFDLDQKGIINNVGIAKSGGDDFDNSAMDAVRSFNGTINDKAGQHTIAIVFCNAVNSTRPVVNNNLKKDGYVGELARGEEKPVRIIVSSRKSDNWLDELNQEIRQKVHYPNVDKNKRIAGRVIAMVDIGNNGGLRSLNILNSPSNSLSQAVFDVIKDSQVSKKMPAGTFLIPINFTLSYIDNGTELAPVSLPPASEAEKKKFEYYNDTVVSTSTKTLKALQEIVIHDYVKRP
jgi:TonB family protein